MAPTLQADPARLQDALKAQADGWEDVHFIIYPPLAWHIPDNSGEIPDDPVPYRQAARQPGYESMPPCKNEAGAS